MGFDSDIISDDYFNYKQGYCQALEEALKLHPRSSHLDNKIQQQKFREGVAAMKTKIKGLLEERK